MKFPYRKSIVRSENGLEIHIFDVRLEDVQEMKTEEAVLSIEKLVDQHDLIVYNDDVNTFDHVIESLVK
ncbi:hypothetical protein ANCCEY_15461, partial [Ancylostoma ceylanicum]